MSSAGFKSTNEIVFSWFSLSSLRLDWNLVTFAFLNFLNIDKNKHQHHHRLVRSNMQMRFPSDYWLFSQKREHSDDLNRTMNRAMLKSMNNDKYLPNRNCRWIYIYFFWIKNNWRRRKKLSTTTTTTTSRKKKRGETPLSSSCSSSGFYMCICVHERVRLYRRSNKNNRRDDRYLLRRWNEKTRRNQVASIDR